MRNSDYESYSFTVNKAVTSTDKKVSTVTNKNNMAEKLSPKLETPDTAQQNNSGNI